LTHGVEQRPEQSSLKTVGLDAVKEDGTPIICSSIEGNKNRVIRSGFRKEITLREGVKGRKETRSAAIEKGKLNLL